jgi:hypothetical protein
MDFDHISICKVADKKSQIYRQIKRFIEKNLTTSVAQIPLNLTQQALHQNIAEVLDRSIIDGGEY